ncbi:5-methyltetrahydropteroyltriglutamate--homocysteine methyltransferase [Saccharothrix sp. ALI-22-I]|uniref:cobalamin-independent methionine synthase II family protein n=1 Tax=Saccharothrix sp. ALI-22-I TaxID=1933778 RepID=UPI00097C2C38|nr:cobalamin-independent methionine synthase II family protein [Saccharothrix sp. ALI-22-I]ONI90038.1 5-methyltetrahydropteroyltriglutamate--homocysteine methyltransferase [Saccharothrix sp. ALI-22-I]
MTIPTEPIGSIPRPPALVHGLAEHAAGRIDQEALDALTDDAIADTIECFALTDSPVITDGEQAKPSFVTYPIAGSDRLAAGGVTIPFEDGHTRQLPSLADGPFTYGVYADSFLLRARQHTDLPVKQAVIAPSALSLLYPASGLDGYPRERFLTDLADESERDIRRSLDAGAHSVQLDFTEGRLSLKLDPSKGVLRDFIALNNEVLGRFSDEERKRIGVHSCPGGDFDSTHSLDVDYAELLPELFQLAAGNFYVQLASEADRPRTLEIIARHLKSDQRVFIGVIDPINPEVETPEQVRDRVLEAAEHLPVDQLGTCDDCGFSPFSDDTSTSRDTAFRKIAARVAGTRMAEDVLAG